MVEYKGFAFETVMSSQKSIDHLKLARENGFSTYTFYVTTNDPEINVARVQKRAREQDGHSIDPDTIRSRHARSLEFLPEAVLNSDISKIIDTTSFENIRQIDFGIEQSALDRMNGLKIFLQEGRFPQRAIDVVLSKIAKIPTDRSILSSPLSECGREVGRAGAEVVAAKTIGGNDLMESRE